MGEIKTIPVGFHKRVYGQEPDQRPAMRFKDADLEAMVDRCEVTQKNIDACHFDWNLEELEKQLGNPYYKKLLDAAVAGSWGVQEAILPDLSNDYPVNCWFNASLEPVAAPQKSVLCLDFETVMIAENKIAIATVEGEDGDGGGDADPDFEALLPTPNDFKYIPTKPTCATIYIFPNSKGNLAPGYYFWIWDAGNPADLADFGFNNIIVAHNANYDRSFVKSSFYLSDTNIWVDTQSLAMAMLGMADDQLMMYRSKKVVMPWMDYAVGGALSDIYFYFTGEKLSKEVRDFSVKGGVTWVLENMPTLLHYNAKDVHATVVLFTHLWSRFSRNYNPVSINGLFLMSKEILTFNEDFFEYKRKAIKAGNQVLIDIQQVLVDARDQALARITEATTDPWLSQLDWTTSSTGKFKGIPKWYVGYMEPTLTKRSTNFLLGLCWDGSPVQWDGVSLCTVDGWIPHPKEPGKRVVSLFGKNFLPFFESGKITTRDPVVGKKLMALYLSISNWTSIRKRIIGKLEGKKSVMGMIVRQSFDDPNVWLHVPMDRCHGTITRRKAGQLLPAAPNPAKEKIGSEIKSLIRVGENYRILSTDVDAEEARLVDFAGCSATSGYVGSTPLSRINCMGNKADGTDIHSLAAKLLGILRSLAKTRIYAMVYNEGEAKTIAGLKLDGDPNAEENGKMLHKLIKGVRHRNYGYTGGYASESFNALAERLRTSPVSMILGNPITESLRMAGDKDFYNTRFNWLVQTSGVDFLQILMGAITFIAKSKGIFFRILYTIHDEIHVLCRAEDSMNMVKVMNTAHGYAWMLAVRNMGLDTCPLGYLFPESISIDRCLRKSTKYTCETPTQAPLDLKGVDIFPKDLA